MTDIGYLMGCCKVAGRVLAVALGVLAVAWAALGFARGGDGIRRLKDQILLSRQFEPATLDRVVSTAPNDLSPCNTHAQLGLLLAEMRLADEALRRGAVSELDRRTQSLQGRLRDTLACAPRQSLVWLIAFNLEVLRGRLDQRAFALLTMSYETSANEAWISIRRSMAALPLVAMAPDELKPLIFREFRYLVRDGFVQEAVSSFARAPSSAREELLDQIRPLPRYQEFVRKLQGGPSSLR